MRLFEVNNLKEVHIYSENIEFPIAIYICSEKEKALWLCLSKNLKVQKFSSYEICRWCQTHNLLFQILYPFGLGSVVKNPSVLIKYLKIRRKLMTK